MQDKLQKVLCSTSNSFTLTSLLKIQVNVQHANPGDVPPTAHIDHRKANNLYQSCYGDNWKEQIKRGGQNERKHLHHRLNWTCGLWNQMHVHWHELWRQLLLLSWCAEPNDKQGCENGWEQRVTMKCGYYPWRGAMLDQSMQTDQLETHLKRCPLIPAYSKTYMLEFIIMLRGQLCFQWMTPRSSPFPCQKKWLKHSNAFLIPMPLDLMQAFPALAGLPKKHK